MIPSATNTVLHLLRPGESPWRTIEPLRLLRYANLAGARHAPLILGSSADERAAAALGVDTLDRINLPAGRAGLAARPLRRFLRARPPVTAIHAWSADAASIARAAAPEIPLFTTDIDRDATPASTLRITPPAAPPRDLPFPVDPARHRDSARAHRRQRWGVDDETLVITLLGNPPQGASAYRLAFLLGLLAEMGRNVVGVAHPRAFQMERGRRLIHSLRGWWRLIGDDAPPWELLPACDIALHRPRPSNPRLRRPMRRPARPDAAAFAIAYALPIISLADDALRPLAHEAPDLIHFVEADDPVRDARAIIRAAESPEPQRAQARAVAEAHAPSRFLEPLDQLYASVLSSAPAARHLTQTRRSRPQQTAARS